MFLQKFLSKIGDFFNGLFNSASKTWKKLSPEIQKSMLWGSGIIAVINKYKEDTPAFIIEMITKKWPELPVGKLTDGLKKVAESLRIAENINDADLETTIKNMQAYLSKQKPNGKIWATLSHAAASILAVVIAPAGTRVAAVVSLLEFVYQQFVKPDIEKEKASILNFSDEQLWS